MMKMLFFLCVGVISLLFVGLPMVVDARPLERPWYNRPSYKKPKTDQSDAMIFQMGVKAYRSEDYQKAYTLWLPLARRQDPAAQKNVGMMMIKGLGGKKEVLRGVDFLKQAANYGLASAQWSLGKIYLNGEPPVQKDVKKALYWMKQAKMLGHPQAVKFFKKRPDPLPR